VLTTAMTAFIVLIVLAGLYILSTYNRLVTFKNRVKEAGSDIEVQMKRRYDLISNLMGTVKGYASHEKNILDAVIKARNVAMQRIKPNLKMHYPRH
jgi:LemA protein